LLSSANAGTPAPRSSPPIQSSRKLSPESPRDRRRGAAIQLTRHIVALLPNLGDTSPQQVRNLAEAMTDRALAMRTYGEHRGAVVGATSELGAVAVSGSVQAHVPVDERLANGRSSWQRPGSETYATAGTLVAERALRQAAIAVAGRAAPPPAVRAWLDARTAAGLQLGADQRAAIEGILTGRQQLSILVGPAGTGKSLAAPCSPRRGRTRASGRTTARWSGSPCRRTPPTFSVTWACGR
jgi:hypothetical protein